MDNLTKFPLLVFVASFIVLWISARVGAFFRRRSNVNGDVRHDLDVIVAATLTLLGLIIGFSFSMAINRYDQRKHYEEEEANAIGTEYLRADLIPATDAMKVRELLKKYLDQRLLFYTLRNDTELSKVALDTGRLQTEWWDAARTPLMAKPPALMALVVSGMNDVLNSQGYTQAEWLNRIPTMAWFLMIAIAIFANFLLGYDARHAAGKVGHLLVLPLVLSTAFVLIADIDSPRRGLIRVHPVNLTILQQSLHGPQ
jgi:hypothetical protein